MDERKTYEVDGYDLQAIVGRWMCRMAVHGGEKAIVYVCVGLWQSDCCSLFGE